MHNTKCVAVTGATGFLGTRIIQELIDQGATVIALGRPGAYNTLETRLKSLWWDTPALTQALGTRILPVTCDITMQDLAIDEASAEMLKERVTHIIHTAADVRPTASKKQLKAVNLDGTANVLTLARTLLVEGMLQQFIQISTAYVAGTDDGPVEEKLLNTKKFSSNYERYKAEAEKLVVESGIPYAIVRPAMIVGDSQTGKTYNFNTVYYLLKQYLRGDLSVAPVPADLRLNIIPVDCVAKIATGALGQLSGFIANATLPSHQLPTAKELADFTCNWAKEEGIADLPAMKFVPVPGLSKAGQARNLRKGEKSKGKLENLLTLAPYFGEKRPYISDNAWQAADMTPPVWETFAAPLLRYAVDQGFLNHTDRTVFQQMGVRQSARSTSIKYHDVTPDGIVDTDPAKAKEQTLRIARALCAAGLKPGDRVAVVGINSVRYHLLDAACGLIGLVTVPLYYTTAGEEIVELVQRSNSIALFVGTEKLIADLVQRDIDIPLISILDNAPEGDITSWEAFLSGGDDDSIQLPPPPSPDALATIRYTSGTTGKPKGTLFTYGQLRWMGATMASIIDWETRTSSVRYLSFLPLSHVVEGILVAYAPYYLLTNVDMYYLQDFGSVEKALPQVRPTIFFSVPRFYEKVWNAFVSTGAGKFFDGLSDGPLKRALAAPMRKALLKKAGLDSCRQLIVGSAPLGIELQRKYESLGITIYDAFGVTEAPLVTLSRLGKNEPGSVGDLLPETEVRLTDEGIVQVKGPQVTIGYDGAITSALTEDGWFDTGDFGAFTPSGRLVLKGRKKDLIVTSYGKNIAPQKLEGMLKSIDGISEAVLVGEGKPFITALLWSEGDLPQDLEERIHTMNDTVSHPERIKRWIVAKRPLAISAGELTPNLKVRRTAVVETRSELVHCLYENWDSTPEDCLMRGTD